MKLNDWPRIDLKARRADSSRFSLPILCQTRKGWGTPGLDGPPANVKRNGESFLCCSLANAVQCLLLIRCQNAVIRPVVCGNGLKDSFPSFAYVKVNLDVLPFINSFGDPILLAVGADNFQVVIVEPLYTGIAHIDVR